ncbi:MAG: bacteriocin-protection protein [Lysobacter sp.]|nr:MAG: bacteriocin-protection protein [Lysobacter sp.]
MAERGKARKATTPKAAAPKTSPSARKAPSTPAAKPSPRASAASKSAAANASTAKRSPARTSAATRAPKSASKSAPKPASNAATRKSGTDANTPLPDALPVIAFVDEAAWETWLIAHADAPGLWLKIAKKTAGIASVDYAGALDVALCHGWIDGQKRGFDADYFLQRFTPRRPKSLWSKINIGHVERLIAAGRMRAGGQREIDAAKADGRWAAAYDGASRMDVPEALAAALARDPKAAAFFETLNKTNRYAVCWRVQTAKTEATRASRVEALVAMLARGEKIHG